MRIDKPDQVLFWPAAHARGGQPSLVLTLGWLIDADGQAMDQARAWPWLLERFADGPFDNGLKKSRGSFAVAGQAYAPAGTTVAQRAISVRCGLLAKTLHVHGPRRWQRPLGLWQPGPAQPFSVMPVDLTHAYGGPDWARNPDGMGYCEVSSSAEGLCLPCIESVEAPCLAPSDRPPLASLRPLPLNDVARQGWLGSLDDHWWRERFPFLPDDADPRWYDEVAQDQCHSAYWRGDEQWSAQGMHPQQERVEGRLPGLRPRLLLRWQAEERADSEAPLDLDTLWLFPDQGRVLMLYRAEVAVQDCDGADIQALGVICERLSDPVQSFEACVRQCWPVTEPAPAPALPQAPDHSAARTALQGRLQAGVETFHRQFMHERQSIIDQVAPAMRRQKQAFDPAIFAPVPAPDLLARLEAAAKPPALDFRGFTQRIEDALSQARSEAETRAREVLRRMGLDYDKEMLKAAKQLHQAPAADPERALAAMPLSPQHRVETRTGMRAAQARMEQVEQRVTAMQDELNARLAAIRLPGKGLSAAAPCLDRPWLEARYRAGESLRGVRLVGLDLKAIELVGADLSDAVVEGCNWVGADLRDCDFTGTRLNGCDFSTAQLERLRLAGAYLNDCRFTGASMVTANVEQAYVAGCDFTGAQLSQADLREASFKQCVFKVAQMEAIEASRVNFHRCDFEQAQMRGAQMPGSSWEHCQMLGVQLEEACLRSARLSRVQAQGAVLRQGQLQGMRLSDGCDFSRACLRQADLEGASLADSRLMGAFLAAANLRDALLLRCDLSATDGARLCAESADLSGCDLREARWPQADLQWANLRKTRLDHCDLSAANLAGATTQGARGQGLQLSGACLERCRLREDLHA